jgi:hypothetical protein
VSLHFWRLSKPILNRTPSAVATPIGQFVHDLHFVAVRLGFPLDQRMVCMRHTVNLRFHEWLYRRLTT